MARRRQGPLRPSDDPTIFEITGRTQRTAFGSGGKQSVGTGRFKGGGGGGGSTSTPVVTEDDVLPPVTKESLQTAFKNQDIKQEQQRIKSLRETFVASGGRTREVTRKDAVTGRDIILRTTKKPGGGFSGGERIFERIDPTTGETITQTFEKDKRGRVRGTGGIKTKVTKVVKQFDEKLNIPFLFQDSTQQPDSNKTQSFFNIVKTSETYPELIGTLYDEKVPPGFKERVSKGTQRFKRGLNVLGVPFLWEKTKQGTGFLGEQLEKVGLPSKEEIQAIHSTPEGQEAIKIQQFLLFGASATPAGIGSRVTKEIVPLRKTKNPVFVENIQSRVNLATGNLARESSYKIFTEKLPPRISVETSFLRESLGRKPKIKFLPSVVSETTTPFGATLTKEFLTLETKGGKVGQLSSVAGVSEKIELVNIGELSNTQKYLVRQGAKSQTGGVAVADKSISKIFPKEQEFFLSNLEVNKLARVKAGGKKSPSLFVDEYKPGKTTNRFEAFTSSSSLKETDDLLITKSKTLFKDITKPLPRASGQTPILEGITFENLKPTFFGEAKSNIIVPADIVKTPLSKTFQEQITKNIPVFPKAPPPATTKVIPISKTTSPTISFPKTISRFSGTGLYERTTGGQIPLINMKQNDLSFSTTRTSLQPLTETKSFTLLKNLSSPTSRSIGISILKTPTKEILRTPTKGITKTLNKVIQKTAQKQSQKIVQKQAFKLAIKPFIPFTRTPPKPPKRPPTFPKMLFPKSRTSIRQPKQFKVFLRRFGEFKLVGKTTSQRQAFNIGRQQAGGTLGATFKVEGAGVNQPISIPGFRTKKSKKGRLFIELPKFRLSKKTETREIQQAKRSKPRRKTPVKRKRRKK